MSKTKEQLQEKIDEQETLIATLSETISELESALDNEPTDSGHNDPGVTRETKVERQTRLRRRVKRD